ncbi:MAG: class I SAM-dependent methyltransferase [Verrucomicrobiota bacterium]
MYQKLSGRVYDALHDKFKDYVAECAKLRAVLQRHAPKAKALLDVACGTGRHLEHLRKYYHVEGLDLSAELLRTARKRCPRVPFHQANMVNFDLDRRFDVIICLFGSIGYVKTIDNLEQAISSMARHLKPGGMLFVEPWLRPENYWTGRLTLNFVDQPELKIAWMYLSELQGRISVFDMHYLVGTPQGVDHFTERDEMGLFTHEEYVEAFRKCGLGVRHDPTGLFGYGMYTGVDRRSFDAPKL